MTPTAIVLLADGFEEIEAVAIIDVLRRGGIGVTVAGVGGTLRTGSHGIGIATDASLKDATGGEFDAVVLPGGQPGTSNLLKSPEVKDLILRQHKAGRILAAICAAPSVLAAAGILDERDATCHPSVEPQMGRARLRKDRVVVDDRLVTSRGPGTAIDFSLKLVELLSDTPQAEALRAKLLAG